MNVQSKAEKQNGVDRWTLALRAIATKSDMHKGAKIAWWCRGPIFTTGTLTGMVAQSNDKTYFEIKGSKGTFFKNSTRISGTIDFRNGQSIVVYKGATINDAHEYYARIVKGCAAAYEYARTRKAETVKAPKAETAPALMGEVMPAPAPKKRKAKAVKAPKAETAKPAKKRKAKTATKAVKAPKAETAYARSGARPLAKSVKVELRAIERVMDQCCVNEAGQYVQSVKLVQDFMVLTAELQKYNAMYGVKAVREFKTAHGIA